MRRGALSSTYIKHPKMHQTTSKHTLTLMRRKKYVNVWKYTTCFNLNKLFRETSPFFHKQIRSLFTGRELLLYLSLIAMVYQIWLTLAKKNTTYFNGFVSTLKGEILCRPCFPVVVFAWSESLRFKSRRNSKRTKVLKFIIGWGRSPPFSINNLSYISNPSGHLVKCIEN